MNKDIYNYIINNINRTNKIINELEKIEIERKLTKTEQKQKYMMLGSFFTMQELLHKYKKEMLKNENN